MSRNYHVSINKQKNVTGKDWGIYCQNQAYAKALALALWRKTPPEAHGSGYYGHYHDQDHIIHIWFGSPMKY